MHYLSNCNFKNSTYDYTSCHQFARSFRESYQEPNVMYTYFSTMYIVKQFWIPLFLLLSLILKAVLGVKCYVCQSETDASCGDVFTLSRHSDDFIGHCRTSCFKFVAARGDNRGISRGCLPTNKIIPRCKYDRDGDIYGTFCACNEDFCNHVTSVHQSRSYIVIMLLFFILRILFRCCG
ncbi:uncharacterized protein LOC123535440 [Mercenaria mercenaria]|uniref:uncharacterized protein LOC123535440 n=1 Tax=Mercenaria mercenaria TaxID=6596 RepID=UPI00234E8830|nr:uncharacterized protein LOC123535440 [Mercenaria mercenaria]